MLEGIDTSSDQGQVTWRTVKEAGKSFGFVKATEGLTVEDDDFPSSWSQMHTLNMPRIAYQFFYDWLGGADQCSILHNYVRNNGRFHYKDALAIDIEEVSVSDAQLCIDQATAFIRYAWESINKPVIIYTNADTWINLLGNPTNAVFAACPLWQASYGPNVARLAPWPNGPSFLQYSDTGHCPGVNATVDLDRFYGSMPELLKILTVVPHV